MRDPAHHHHRHRQKVWKNTVATRTGTISCQGPNLQALAIDRLDLEDVGVLIQGDLALLQRGLGGVLLVEDVVQLLEGAVLGLWDEEIDDDGLDGVPDGEDDVGAPANLLHGNRPGELVEKHGCAEFCQPGSSGERGERRRKRASKDAYRH